MQVIDTWDGAMRQMAALLKETDPDAPWIARMQPAIKQMRDLARHAPDAALYLLIQRGGGDTAQYSTHHAMLCAVICELCAEWFEWTAEEIDALVHAALTMNLAMSSAQDALARQSGPLSPPQRELIERHPERSAELLAKAGVTDALWLDVVRQHHAAGREASDGIVPPAQRLARLLHRVDIYTAKLSCRASRKATTPSIAARDAFLDPAGVPDATGATILRVIGLFPPGTFVLLDSGEVGVVVRRGAKAHTPVVALLRRADGATYVQPVYRDTADGVHGVVRGLAVADVKVRLHHERVLRGA